MATKMQHWPKKSERVRSSCSRQALALLLAFAIAAVAPACKHKPGRVVEPAGQPVSEKKNPDTSIKSAAALVAIPGVRNVEFAQMSIRGRGTLENEQQNVSFNYKINIEKDRRIWASLGLFGIEGARVLATPDSFWVIDRLNKQYAAQGYQYLEQRIGLRVDFALLQDLLIGNAGPVAQQSLDVNDAQHFTVDRQKMLLRYQLATGGKVLQLQASDSVRAPLSVVNYAEFATLEQQSMPMQILVQVLRPKANQVTLEHREVDLHPQNLSFSFTIPQGYNEIR
jgi:hypothetical protein